VAHGGADPVDGGTRPGQDHQCGERRGRHHAVPRVPRGRRDEQGRARVPHTPSRGGSRPHARPGLRAVPGSGGDRHVRGQHARQAAAAAAGRAHRAAAAGTAHTPRGDSRAGVVAGRGALAGSVAAYGAESAPEPAYGAESAPGSAAAEGDR
jgi:hypothetical protein